MAKIEKAINKGKELRDNNLDRKYFWGQDFNLIQILWTFRKTKPKDLTEVTDKVTINTHRNDLTKVTDKTSAKVLMNGIFEYSESTLLLPYALAVAILKNK